MSDLYPIVPRPSIDTLWRRLQADTNVTTETASYTVASDIHWIRMDTSGGNRTVTLPPASTNHSRRIGIIKTTSDVNTVTPTASSGDTLNNSKVLSRQWESIIFVAGTELTWDGFAASNLTLGTVQASTSGTVITFSGIPSWVQKITFMYSGLSTSGTSIPMIQLGDAGGLETTGYLGSGGTFAASSAATLGTTGFLLAGSWAATSIAHGALELSLFSASTNTWVAQGCGGFSNAANIIVTGGSKPLSAILTQLALTTVNGTDTFDAGSINIVYQ